MTRFHEVMQNLTSQRFAGTATDDFPRLSMTILHPRAEKPAGDVPAGAAIPDQTE